MQHNTPEKYIKNYVFDYDFGRPWGQCQVTMTSVLGHLTSAEFPADYKKWEYPPPESLFDAPVNIVVSDVSYSSCNTQHNQFLNTAPRTRRR